MSAPARIRKLEADKIVRAAVEDATAKDFEAIQVRENELVEAVTIHILRELGLDSQIILMRRIDRAFIHSIESITLSANAVYVKLEPRGVAGKPGPLLPWVLHRSDKKIDSRNPLAAELVAHDQARQDARERQTMLKSRVGAVLSQATTFGKLASIWPEGEPYWGRYRDQAQARSKKNLPAVQIDEVNRLLGIPKEDTRVA